MAAAVERLHQEGELTGGKRGVMRQLYREGPMTVPEMARSRPVTRQHIQSIVNELRAAGWVELLHNPAHKRSKRVALTEAGRARVEEMLHKEAELLHELEIPFTADDVDTATRLLQHFCDAFADFDWDALESRLSPAAAAASKE
jgi:DNA-binding MarR family transcriptional regulator